MRDYPKGCVMRARSIYVSVLVLLVAGALVPGASGARAGGRTVLTRHLETSRREVMDFWTTARMERAAVADAPRATRASLLDGSDTGVAGPRTSGGAVGPSMRTPVRESVVAQQELAGLQFESFEIPDTQTFPNSTHGRLFAQSPTAAWSCSGTVVSSASESLVLTAGHCLYDIDTGEWATAVIFIPGYRNGTRPFSTWSATDISVLSGYVNGAGNPEYDLGAMRVAPLAGTTIQDTTGARGYLFNGSGNQLFQAFGYPAASPFDGSKLWSCRGNSGPRANFASGPDLVSIGCDMTQGSSGGGWIVTGDKINSVVSVSIQGYPDMLWGPYFGAAAQSLWTNMGGGAHQPDPIPTPTPTPTPSPSVSPLPTVSPTPTTPPDPEPGTPVTHEMGLTLRLVRSLVAKGRMTAADGYLPCARRAPVVIFRKAKSGWKNVGSGYTKTDGTYRISIPDRNGRYLAASPEGSVDDLNLCSYSESTIHRRG